MEMKYKNRVFYYDEIIDEKTFTIPNYQRGYAWKKKGKQEFIKTLINGEPFGTILIYEDNNNVYLIDGLQRINTIREFNNNKYLYLTTDVIDMDNSRKFVMQIKKIYKACGKNISGIKNRIADDKKVNESIINKIIDNNGDLEAVYKALKKSYGMSSFPDKYCCEFKNIIKNILKTIDKLCNIKSIKIYALEYTGKAQRLPDIFYNLNTGGATLSKYDVLPSLWNDIKYVIKDDEIIDTVYKRYEELKTSSQFKILIKKQDLKSDGITLFEYCYAIGKLLYKPEYKFTSFLGNGKDAIEPISFSILALLVGLNENQTSEIGKKLKNVTQEFLVELKNIIIEGFSVLKAGLYEYVKSEKVTYVLNDGDKTKTNSNEIQENFNYSPSKYMIYHMFMSYIKKNYTINLKDSEIVKNRISGLDNWNENFVQNLHLHYFYDVITNYWGGEHRQVSSLMDDLKDDNMLYRYSYVISNNMWEEAFKILKEEQMSFKSKNFCFKTKLFLDYLVKFKIKENPELKNYFKKSSTKEPFSIDYEHIIPLTRFDERGIDDIPKYSLGNACYLTSKVNKSKHGKTLYEQIEEFPGYKVDTKFTEFVSYPKEEDISFVNENKEIFKEKYMEFISNRIDSLIKEFIEYKV